MKKSSFLLASAIFGLSIFGIASSAKADMIKISAKQACSRSGVLAIGGDAGVDVGHVSVAFYDDAGNLLETKGMWPDGVNTNNANDQAMANGEGCGLVSRTIVVNPQVREWAQHQVASPGGTGCHEYSYVYKRAFGADKCTCVQFGTRVWKEVTNKVRNKGEVWRGALTPQDVQTRIRSANGQRDHWTIQSHKSGKPGRLL